jgi:hypothetical protein
MLRTIRDVLLGIVLLLVVLEGVLRLLPGSTATHTGYHVDPAILGYPPGHAWRVSTGWDLRNAQRLRANNLGFAAERDFVSDPRAIALVGDSYVEASMLAARDRPAAQLEQALGGARAVYAFGGPGSSLLDYVERIRFARDRTGVQDVVVLMEAGDVRQSLCGSGNVHSACLDPTTLAPRVERLPPPSALKQVLRESALAQYMFSQIRVDAGQLWRALTTRQVPEEEAADDRPRRRAAAVQTASPAAQAVVRRFVEQVRPLVPGRLVIVVDGRRDPAAAIDARLAAERAAFIDGARAAGLTVIDAEPLFARHAASSSRSLQVGPYDGHLNAIGIGLVMQAAAQALR